MKLPALGKAKLVKLLISFLLLIGLTSYFVINNSVLEFGADEVVIDTGESVNHVSNASFEEGKADWNLTTEALSIDESETRTGMKSLLLDNRESGIFSPAYHTLNLTPGETYTASGYAKMQSMVGDQFHISIAIEFIGAEGKYLSNQNTSLSSASDWKKFPTIKFTVPAEAEHTILSLFLSNGASGKVWFDDLTINNVINFNSIIRYPNYRGMLFENQERKLIVGASAVGNLANPTDDLDVRIEIRNDQKDVVTSKTIVCNSQSSWNDVEFDINGLSTGSYEVESILINRRTNTELKTEISSLKIMPKGTAKPTVFIDEQGRTIVNGQPFFALGIVDYSNPLSEIVNNLDLIADSKFNTVLPTLTEWIGIDQNATYLEEAEKRNLKIIFNIKDAYAGSDWAIQGLGDWRGPEAVFEGMVTSLKDNPTILAWFINDELDDVQFNQTIQDHYKFIVNNDYNHPVWQNFWYGQDTRSHANGAEILSIDNYPVSAASVSRSPDPPKMEVFGEAAKSLRQETMSSRGLWMIPESKDNLEGARAATYDEMVNLGYQALVNGARGLVYHNLSNILSDSNSAQIWQETKRMSEHMDSIKSIILGDDVGSDFSVTSSNNKISTVTRKVGNDYYVLAVNPYHEQIETAFTLGSNQQADKIIVGVPGTNEREILVSNKVFSDTIGSLETRVYKLVTDAVSQVSGSTGSTQLLNLSSTPSTQTQTAPSVTNQADSSSSDSPSSISISSVNTIAKPSSSSSAEQSQNIITDNIQDETEVADTFELAPPKLVIQSIHADAKGIDLWNLNDEYIVVKNNGEIAENLLGWKIRNKVGTSIELPSHILAPKKTVIIHSGSYPKARDQFGAKTTVVNEALNVSHIYLSSKNEIWDNMAETASLLAPDSLEMASKSYSASGSFFVRCLLNRICYENFFRRWFTF